MAALVVVGGAGATSFVWLTREPESTAPRAGGPSLEHPLTPAQQLVADSGDPAACAVSFSGDGIALDLQLQSEGSLYQGLPIPVQDGRVFAGWFATAEDAAAQTVAARVNGADLVACTDREVALFGAWTTPEANAAAGVKVPILMYHQFTADPEGEPGWLRGNYAYIGDFEAQMNHIATTGFYLPTWDELSAFIDGRLSLPARSVIITDDDADQTWFDLAVPVIDAHGLLATSFMITAYRQDPAPSPFVLRRSHTHDMHQAGENGKGRMVNWTADQIAADLTTSAQVLGVSEVVAYPFGHFNDTAKQGVAQAGFEMARTIEPGYVEIGTDKLALPVVRVDYGMGLEALISRIG
ncbi:polysaccharide deacetylase family protein [Microbacterium sp. 179-I 3D4 NHS]|uniref:polysaccharide deacetylase family protein n=1 Tax=Microbacterium sp. 179-I 3D4 NHS TaxID=3142381 RepID=UPI00399FC92B